MNLCKNHNMLLFNMINRSIGLYRYLVIVFFITSFSSVLHAQDLLDIYELALQHDPVLKQSIASQQAIGESRPQSIANFLPNIAATGISNQNRLVNDRATYQGLGIQNYMDNNLTLNITQPLFHWEHWIQLSQSDNQIAQAEADYQTELQKMMVKIIDAYFNILAANDNLDFIIAEKEAIARQLDQAKQRHETGLIDITQVYEAQTAFDRAIANEIEATNNIDNQKEALTAIIGEQTLIVNRLANTIPLIKPEPNDITAWSESAESNNFSIISAFNQMEFSRKSIDIQRNGHLPKLDLIASMGEYATSSNFGLQGQNEIIGLRLNMPLYEGGAVNSRTRQAQFKFEQSNENLIATKRTVNKQVKDAYRAIITSLNRIKALQSAINSAEAALKGTETAFDVGLRTIIDVLIAQKNLYQDKRDYSRARYDYLLNTIKLKQASSSLSRQDLEMMNNLLVRN